MKENKVKKELKAGKATVGSFLSIAHPTVAEVMAQSGFDWLVMDMEHGIIGIESVQTMAQAMSGTDVLPMARVPWNDFVVIKQVLETGVMGLVIPMVNTAEHAEMAVKAVKFPLEGIRGIGCQRPTGFGAWFND
ncbi:MAG: hypothetical protein COX46_01180 [bacterium (Candidatus Ratteibacteria) CG23_combo_of_CG06-09_8_20_14_all_48_7]|uniref:HpcH/HpaI aldolase/citrate lyase domain-containing protein n=1 Tax=bacterium (Candidatus Ratteibacteria) CG23_combo_of_CG06-09_8_20_14_all_48_7 TaxID=2014292 RepID=A0A2G9YBL4_9BACT|nr:MAG: hypothetical protein COX46_01180 [bacterium (Candidatus Ratteibacteria) CG23_combo_of_CG06-09_8_20_14_all_48_7]